MIHIIGFSWRQIYEKKRYGQNISVKNCSCWYLPQVFLDVFEKTGFACPAIRLEGLSDITLDVGSEGTGAVVVFVIAFAGVDVDEVVLDGFLYAGRHVVIDSVEADRHTDGLIIAVHRTVVTLHLRIVEVDAVGESAVFRNIGGKDATETVLAKRAGRRVAYTIVRSFLCKDSLSGLGSVVVLVHFILL